MVDWQFETIDVPADGSCFFTSISIAMNDSMDRWVSITSIKEMMMHHWDRYSRLGLENTDDITPKFIRYMSASAMDTAGLELYNAEASILKKKQFDTPEELARHIIHSRCWADHSMIRSFMQSMGYTISVVVFDSSINDTVYMPKEWTYKKELYTCLQLDGQHYSPMRLSYNNDYMKLCVDRGVIRKMMHECKDGCDIDNIY